MHEGADMKLRQCDIGKLIVVRFLDHSANETGKSPVLVEVTAWLIGFDDTTLHLANWRYPQHVDQSEGSHWDIVRRAIVRGGIRFP